MENTCQRCHETLRAADRYCAVCGLPQLIYIAADMPSAAEPSGGMFENRNGLREDKGLSTDAVLRGFAWRPALRAALTVAIPTGILCSGLSEMGQALGLIWITGAALWAVRLYQRQTGGNRLTAGFGARVGLLTGLIASWLMMAVNGLQIWVERFVLHQGAAIDQAWLIKVGQGLEKLQGLADASGMTKADAAQFLQAYHASLTSIDGRALLGVEMPLEATAFFLLAACSGGALGARFLFASRG